NTLDRDALLLVLVDHQFSTLVSAIFALAGMVECFSEYAKVPHLKPAVSDALNRLSKLPAVEEALNGPF
ncbi:MAG: hypothetical protein P8Y58_08395, partial [Novosphingobium sp.]